MLVKAALGFVALVLHGCSALVSFPMGSVGVLHEKSYSGYILEKFKCNLNHAEGRFYYGVIQDEIKSMDQKTVVNRLEVVLENRYKVAYWPEQSGVDSTDWWCLPRKKYCYSEFPFELASGVFEKGEVRNIETTLFRNDQNDTMLTIMAEKYERNCAVK